MSNKKYFDCPNCGTRIYISSTNIKKGVPYFDKSNAKYCCKLQYWNLINPSNWKDYGR